MNYKNFDSSRLEDKILDVILPPEIIYKEDKGEGVAPQLRHGRIDDGMIYKERKVINTRNGQKLTTPEIKVYFKAFTGYDSILIIDIYDFDMKCLLKKFTIKSKQNDYSLDDMKSLVDEVTNLLTGTDEGKCIALIELIRSKEDLKFEEVAQ